MSSIIKVILKLAIIIICVFAVIVVAAYLFFNFRSDPSPQESAPQSVHTQDVNIPSGGVTMTVEITEQQAEEIVTGAVKSSLPIANLKISFDDSGSATMSGKINKSDLKSATSGSNVPDAVWIALKLLPETLDVKLDFTPTIDADGNIDIGAESCSVSGIKFDAKYLPSGMMDNINNQITKYAADNGVAVTDIVVRDGQMKLSGNVGN